MEQAIETLNTTMVVNQSGSRKFQEVGLYSLYIYIYSSLLLTIVSKFIKSHLISVKTKAGLKSAKSQRR